MIIERMDMDNKQHVEKLNKELKETVISNDGSLTDLNLLFGEFLRKGYLGEYKFFSAKSTEKEFVFIESNELDIPLIIVLSERKVHGQILSMYDEHDNVLIQSDGRISGDERIKRQKEIDHNIFTNLYTIDLGDKE